LVDAAPGNDPVRFAPQPDMARIPVARLRQDAAAEGFFAFPGGASPGISLKSVHFFMKTPLAQGLRVRYLFRTRPPPQRTKPAMTGAR